MTPAKVVIKWVKIIPLSCSPMWSAFPFFFSNATGVPLLPSSSSWSNNKIYSRSCYPPHTHTHTHFDLSMSIFSVFRFWPDVYNVEWARIALSGKGWKNKYSTELWNGSLSITSIQCAHTGVWRLRTHTDTGCGMSISVETSCCHIQRNRSFKELYLRQMLTEAMLTK